MTPRRLPTRNRGFALAIVIVLIMVLSVMVVVMLDRQNAQMLVYKRQLNAYSMHHATAGFGEAIEAWLRNNGQTPLRQALGPGGRAFDLTVEGGAPVRVSLMEAQGLALADLTGLPEEQISMGREMLMRLEEEFGGEAARYTRLDGPLSVSIRTAPRAVLLAAAATALHEEGDPEKLVDALLAAKEEAGAEPIDLGKVILDAEVPAELRSRVVQLFAVEPTLWRGTAELEEASPTWPPREPVIYQFWANIRSGRRGAADDASVLQRSTSILRWERMSVP